MYKEDSFADKVLMTISLFGVIPLIWVLLAL